MNHLYIRYITLMLMLPCLLFLPSCTIVQWSATTFRQADVISSHFSQSMEPFIKTGVVYSEFASIAEFSALFLTDQARMIYADYFFNRNFKSQEEQELSRQRLLKENEHYITFYVIGYQPATIYPTERALFYGEYQAQGPLLGAPDAKWKITLMVDGKEYSAVDVRTAPLPVEYQYFFGRRWSQFKTCYKVRFDARDEFGEEILPQGKHHVVLKFRSVIYDTKLEWTEIAYKLED